MDASSHRAHRARPAPPPTAARQAQRRAHRGDPGRRDRGRVPRPPARDQPRDHDRAARAATDEEEAPGISAGARRRSVLVCEVQQHLGDDRVRAVAMDTTDGLARGARGDRHRRADHRARRGGHARADLQPARRADRPRRAAAGGRRAARHPPGGSARRGPDADDRDVRDRASRSSTCSPPTPRAARSGCSAAPASARRC